MFAILLMNAFFPNNKHRQPMGLKHDKGVADSWDQLKSISTYAFCSFHVLLTVSAFSA